MSSISDSSAVLEKKRLLPQHQAALTLIQGQVVKPNIASFSWLDLCCGKGQIIINLEDNFAENLRQKIEYHIQDINEEYLKVTQKNAEELKFKKVESYTTDIYKFSSVVPVKLNHDFITIINAVHEISPSFLPELIFECLIRLAPSGTLYIYDMETINPLELGAITWTREEIQELVNTILNGITVANYQPNANRWHHSTCNAWSFEIQKEFLIETSDFEKRKKEIIERANDKVTEILKRKLSSCNLALESYTKYGTETQEDEQKRTQLLFDFYSLNRILNK
jgi:SAM-dependent methyltransferase